MSISQLILNWSEAIYIQTPSVANKYNQMTYTNSSITGRLVKTEEEVIIKNGEKTIAKAKLFTNSSLNIDTKVGDYKIISKKECKDKFNVIQFYKYYLK